MNQVQREASYRQMVNQSQRERAAMGYTGVQDPGRNSQTAQGGNSPNPTQTFVREGIMPNGQPWRVTVNETVMNASPMQFGNMHPGNMASRSPAPGGINQATSSVSTGSPGQGLSTADVQNILRGADATQTIRNAMQRSASGASLSSMAGSGQNGGPVAMPFGFRPGLSRAGSRSATPDTAGAAMGGSGRIQATSSTPEVYILSSPTGPRALLVNGNAGTYFTPTTRTSLPPIPLTTRPMVSPVPSLPVPQQPVQTDQAHQDILEQWRQAVPQTPQAQQEHENHHGQQALQNQPPLAGAPLRPNNPGAGALAALIPHIWLLVRLGLFIWWFASPNSSWQRWATVLSVAIAVFIINTGILDGFANQAWGPIRQHLDGLIPLADPARARRENNPQDPAAPNNEHIQAAEGARDPNPREAAARLLARRRHANASWLMDQVRRMERAGLLFLASIAPGVAERHIDHLEAEERAERQRRETEAAAAAAAAETAATNEQVLGDQDAQVRESDNAGQVIIEEGELTHNDGQPAEEEPLVAV